MMNYFPQYFSIDETVFLRKIGQRIYKQINKTKPIKIVGDPDVFNYIIGWWFITCLHDT